MSTVPTPIPDLAAATRRRMAVDVPDTLPLEWARGYATGEATRLLAEIGLVIVAAPVWSTAESSQHRHITMLADLVCAPRAEIDQAAALAGDGLAYARLDRERRRNGIPSAWEAAA